MACISGQNKIKEQRLLIHTRSFLTLTSHRAPALCGHVLSASLEQALSLHNSPVQRLWPYTYLTSQWNSKKHSHTTNMGPSKMSSWSV
jgi:hypothetical protein